MRLTGLLFAAAVLSLVAPLGGGSAAPRLPDALPGVASDHSFPLQAISRASDAQLNDNLGDSVAVSGKVAVVGASGEDGGSGDPASDAGAAYIFRRNRDGASHWGQVRKLMASDAQDRDFFGTSVGISGENAIVGAPYEDYGPGDPVLNAGAAYIFRRDQGGTGNWGQVEKLAAPDAETSDTFGYSVAIHGDTAIVGAPFEDGGPGAEESVNSGAAYMFKNISGFGWIYIKTIRPGNSQGGDQFGISVAISGDLVIVGAQEEDGGSGDPLTGAGTAYIFQRDLGGADGWGEVEQLVASDAGAGDYFGHSVAISGNRAVVGAVWEDGGPGDPTSNAGAAYVFANPGDTGWTEIRKLAADEAEQDDFFGESVAISGGVILVGADSEDGGPGAPLVDAGAAYVFLQNLGGSNAWGQAGKLLAPDAQSLDNFGHSVGLSGRTAVVGSWSEDGGLGDPLLDSGAAYVFSVSLLEAFKAN